MNESLVRALLADQHPDLADDELVEVESGWDNAIFRLGEDLVVRLPRRALAAALIEVEQRWLPMLAPKLPLPIPAPVRIGRPGRGYPWSWSICPWLPGGTAVETPLEDFKEAAETLGGFLSAMHQPAPADAPRNPYRGVPLTQRDGLTQARIAKLSGHIDAAAVRSCWQELVAAPVWQGPPLWLHGDLHPANILVSEGRISSVIDFGDLTAGDPATDLAVAWMLFPTAARIHLRSSAGEIDDDTWTRAQGWALSIGLAIWESSADNPTFAALGRRTIEATLDHC